MWHHICSYNLTNISYRRVLLFIAHCYSDVLIMHNIISIVSHVNRHLTHIVIVRPVPLLTIVVSKTLCSHFPLTTFVPIADLDQAVPYSLSVVIIHRSKHSLGVIDRPCISEDHQHYSCNHRTEIEQIKEQQYFGLTILTAKSTNVLIKESRGVWER